MEAHKDTGWKNTILAAIANYIDAGAIVAGAATLSLWVEQFHLSTVFVGVLGAIGANAISAGFGAIIGGWLCDRFGRRKIFLGNMGFYAIGMLWLVFAAAPWMLVVGFIQVGLAVGAAVPASWSLIVDQAPEGARGRRSGLAQVLWGFGPAVVLVGSYFLNPFGMLGSRIIFAHLALVAVFLMLMHSRMDESERWLEAKKQAKKEGYSGTRELLKWKHLKSMFFLISMYGIWNLWAGTNGFFLPYILHTVGAQTQAASIAFQGLSCVVGLTSVIVVFMGYSDRVNQRAMFVCGSLISVVGMSLLALFPLTTPIAFLYVILSSFGSGFSAQPFFQLWSAELFPTLLRSTAQGISFAVVRIGLGFWSFAVPIMTATGFHTLAWMLTGFLVVSTLIGAIWAPRNEGKSLEQIEAEL